MTNGSKSFLPFHRIKEKEVIVVDGLHPRAFTLSHWKGANHSKYAADTSGEIALNAIAANAKELSISNVSATHFDIDGFVGVLALFYPKLALEYHDVLIEMATIGDFREYDPSREAAKHGLKLCCWMNKMERELFYRPFEEKDEIEECVPKFEYFLKEFPEVLKNTNEFEEVWREEYDQVMKGLSKVERRERIKEEGLMIVHAKETIHYYALFSNSDHCDIILSIYPGGRYELEYKYTTWIDLSSRSNLPRIDLQPLADILNKKERSSYHWNVDKITDTGPILRLEKDKLSKAARYAHPFEREIYPSTWLEEDLIIEIKKYFKKAYEGIKPKKYWKWEEMKALKL